MEKQQQGARFAALGRGVRRRPALAAALSGLVLVALSLGLFGYNATFDLSSVMPKSKESMVVQTDMTSAWIVGAAAPTDVYLTSDDEEPLDKSSFAAYAKKLGTWMVWRAPGCPR